MGRAPRLEFKTPEGISLARKSIVWPAGADHPEPVTVLEFRAGRVQDVLPPSIHPATRKPYRWHTIPRHGFSPLPDQFLKIWLDFDAFRHRARNVCPWAPPEAERAPVHARISRPHTGPSVIEQFNRAHDVTSLLESHGYVKAGPRRWKSPVGKGIAGIVQLKDGRVYSHHQTDPLAGEHACDAFEVFARLEHCDDVRAATRAAAQILGLNRWERR